MPTLTCREYNPATGSFIGNVTSLSFGKTSAGSHTPVKVVDFAFTGVSTVLNVKIALLDAGGLTVNDSPQDVGTDGSSANGGFGIMHSTSFDLATAGGPLTRHFAGLSADGAGDSNNVEIGTKSDTVTQFAYLDVEIGASDLGQGSALLKVYFDFT